ncbi:MAG: hypothetical protein NVS9B12_09690 [Vulcanimicrobiaceae bacterium]
MIFSQALPAAAIRDLLEPAALTSVRIDLTSRCNLRCVYCEVSQPEHAGEDMTDGVAASILSQLDALPYLQVAHVNGHGETTVKPGWEKTCAELQRRGLYLQIITNLSKTFTDEELAALAGMAKIVISIDTVDQDLLKRVRRKVELKQIVNNITLIRMAGMRTGHMPDFGISCGLYDKNSRSIDDLARWAAVLGLVDVTFWDLVKLPDIEGAETVSTLAAMNDAELRTALQRIELAMSILRRYNIPYEVAGDFIAPLRGRVGLHV